MRLPAKRDTQGKEKPGDSVFSTKQSMGKKASYNTDSTSRWKT